VIIKPLNFLLVKLKAYLVAGAEILIPLPNPKEARNNRECQQKTNNDHEYWYGNNLINYSWIEHSH
jgi:hypothetical protein